MRAALAPSILVPAGRCCALGDARMVSPVRARGNAQARARRPRRVEKAELEAFCDAWFEAWSGDRPDLLASFYAEDCRYVDPARPQGIQGREDLRRYFARLLAANPAWTWRRERLDPVDGGFTVTYRAAIPLPHGETLDLKGMDLVLLRGGEIVLNEVHFDMALWLRKLGRAPKG